MQHEPGAVRALTAARETRPCAALRRRRFQPLKIKSPDANICGRDPPRNAASLRTCPAHDKIKSSGAEGPRASTPTELPCDPLKLTPPRKKSTGEPNCRPSMRTFTGGFRRQKKKRKREKKKKKKKKKEKEKKKVRFSEALVEEQGESRLSTVPRGPGPAASRPPFRRRLPAPPPPAWGSLPVCLTGPWTLPGRCGARAVDHCPAEPCPTLPRRTRVPRSR